ncbi:dipeptide ABC transporter ATP-binding protein [Leptolyngbyaceae cyanobacterium UHCC 1019]
MTKPLLQVDQLKIAYPTRHGKLETGQSQPIWSVDGVSFELRAGDRLGLVGESGCGKSTLGRALLRLLPAGSVTQGSIQFAGQSVLDLAPSALRRFRGESVALVFQDPMTRLDALMTIGDHCVETLQAHEPGLSRSQAKDRAIAVLEAVKIPANRWAQYPHEFSGGMRQRVAIALALLLNPKLIVADEPTTSLDVTISAQILQELTRLCSEREMALLLISHDLALVGEYCDRIAVMHTGKFVETGNTQSVLTHPQHDYTRSLLQAALHVQATKTLSTPPPLPPSTPLQFKTQNSKLKISPSTPLLRLQNLKKHYSLESTLLARLVSGREQTLKAVDDITLEIYFGETLGLVGESGCGKSTLSRTILQLVRPSSGRVEFLGRNLPDLARADMQRQRRDLQMIFQDPRACLNPMMTVGQSIADPLLIHQLATPIAAKKAVLEMLERVQLTPASAYYSCYPSELSGGQQQRVAIARTLITRPQLVICDEPVSMLDATVQAQVLDLMQELKQDFHLTYLFITHDLWVARYFCDRIAVMQAGKIVELGQTHDIFSNPQHLYTQTLLQAAPLLSRV